MTTLSDYEFDLLTQYVRRECWNIKGDDELIAMFLIKHLPTWQMNMGKNYVIDYTGINIQKGISPNIVLIGINLQDSLKIGFITPTIQHKPVFDFMTWEEFPGVNNKLFIFDIDKKPKKSITLHYDGTEFDRSTTSF